MGKENRINSLLEFVFVVVGIAVLTHLSKSSEVIYLAFMVNGLYQLIIIKNNTKKR